MKNKEQFQFVTIESSFVSQRLIRLPPEADRLAEIYDWRGFAGVCISFSSFPIPHSLSFNIHHSTFNISSLTPHSQLLFLFSELGKESGFFGVVLRGEFFAEVSTEDRVKGALHARVSCHEVSNFNFGKRD
jgi:hypothetical protein